VETTIAQYRTLVVLASRGPQRMVGLAAALEVASSTAGRMCDRLVRKGLIGRHQARADRSAVLVSITPAGRVVVDQATARRRELIMEIWPGCPPTCSTRPPRPCARSPPRPARCPTNSGRRRSR
jgi:DNA-binding MarR family transcriptional regulator